jgi:hydrogenase maturation factor
VSEGGVKGALTEVLRSLNLSLSFNSADVLFAKGTQKLRQDLLRSPTYGTIIAIVDPETVDEILGKCTDMKVKVSRLGILKTGSRLIVDGNRVGSKLELRLMNYMVHLTRA